MIILGKTNDDKGTQLESLTREILANMGCKNIEVNFVSSGGEEIDVSADYPLPSFGATQYRRLICECKAYARPIDMPHWLKFLGKVYSEEARLKSEISGCFIALSGVNGNVSGHHDQLKINRPNIMLVRGDILLDELKKIYKLSDVENVNKVLGQYTSRRYRSLEVAYYERNVYWIIIFEDDAYTILTAEGNQVEGERLDTLKPMIEGALAAQPYIGLKQEAEAQRRGIQAKKSVVSQIIRNNGRMKMSELVSREEFSFTEPEFHQAIDELIAEGWIVQSDDKTEIYFRDEDKGIFYSHLANMYLFLLSGEARFGLMEMLESDFYESHINEQFVAQIQKIQGNLPLSSPDVQDAIKLLRWSPSAVLWAVQPDPMIVTHRNDPNFKDDESMDRFDRNYFFRQLYGSLRNDLAHPIARAYLLDVYKVREIETKQKIIIKSSTNVELESDLHERLGVGELADNLRGPDGSNKILLLLMENAPEPWEVPAGNEKSQDTDSSDTKS
ncbi:MAG TPA: hypothetical protein VGX92_08100 [Pyrinomonadaceae bacterium]|jgi:hypothetical protein|nr:hypothetical protein [Pyrinomonadaceae bacterium]